MKHLLAFIIAIAIITSSAAQEINFPPSGDNQKAVVTQFIGLVKVTITYSRPDVTGPEGEDRKGKIWGDLVPYGENLPMPWRAGANERTIIEFSHDVMIGDKPLKAGRYGVLMYVDEKAPWTIILTNDAQGWGAFGYKKENDALRIQATPTNCEHTEWLTYGFDKPTMKSAEAFLRWESKEVKFKIDVPNAIDLYVAHFRQALKAAPTFFYGENYQWAADFCANNNVNLEEALRWADRAMAPGFGSQTFSTLSTKANVLNKLNRVAEADQVMDVAIKSTTASVNDIDGYARKMLAEDRVQRALSIFQWNEKKFPDHKFVTALGLADYYASAKNQKNEMRYLQMAISNATERQKNQLPMLNERLTKLKTAK